MANRDTVVAGLQRHTLTFFEHGETLTVPIPRGDSGYFLINIHVDEEAGDAVLETGIYRAPKGRRESVAIRLAELNAKWKHVVWSLREDVVVADVCVDLDMVRDPEHAFILAFLRLSTAIVEDHDRVLVAGRRSRSRRRSRVERELEAILRQSDT